VPIMTSAPFFRRVFRRHCKRLYSTRVIYFNRGQYYIAPLPIERIMSNHFCPSCGAELLSSLFMGSWKQVECPTCNEWIKVDVASPESYREREEEERVYDRYNDVEDDPPGNRLEECRDGQRLVIHVLRGTNGLISSFGGCLLFIVIAFSYFTWDVIWGDNKGSLDGLLVLGVAWGGVATMVGGWIFARFGSTSVMLEPNRLVVEHRLFGTRTHKEYRLGLQSRATLVASHRLWGDLVYGVRISAVGVQPVVAVWMLPGEKRWLARRINRHLRHPDWEDPQVDSSTEVKWILMDGFKLGE